MTGLDIGYRLEDGELTDQLAVRVHVAELTTDALSSIKPNIDIQFIHGGFAPSPASLHVPVTNPQTLERRNPIQPGISIGSFECGTLGLFARIISLKLWAFLHVII